MKKQDNGYEDTNFEGNDESEEIDYEDKKEICRAFRVSPSRDVSAKLEMELGLENDECDAVDRLDMEIREGRRSLTKLWRKRDKLARGNSMSATLLMLIEGTLRCNFVRKPLFNMIIQRFFTFLN
jgi:hypothetical protein